MPIISVFYLFDRVYFDIVRVFVVRPYPFIPVIFFVFIWLRIARALFDRAFIFSIVIIVRLFFLIGWVFELVGWLVISIFNIIFLHLFDDRFCSLFGFIIGLNFISVLISVLFFFVIISFIMPIDALSFRLIFRIMLLFVRLYEFVSHFVVLHVLLLCMMIIFFVLVILFKGLTLIFYGSHSI